MIPLVGAERIVVTKTQIKDFLDLRGKATVRLHQILQTFLCISLSPMQIKIIQKKNVLNDMGNLKWAQVSLAKCRPFSRVQSSIPTPVK